MNSRPAPSIRAKLMRTALLAAGVALLSASAAFVVYDVITFRAAIARRFSVAANLVGSNSVAALVFEDRPAAAKMLSALQGQPNVTGAALYDVSGRLFAQYVQRGTRAPGEVPSYAPPGARFGKGRLRVSHEVFFEGKRVGTVVLESDLLELRQRLVRYALIVLLVSLASLAVAAVISHRLQQSISRPILSLAATARAVSLEENYSVRAKGGGADETGLLIATFNEMLEGIQRRDADLVEARSDLERRVAERTAELTRELAERRRTEAELRRIQELLGEAQAMARVGSWEWDLASGDVWWSDELYRLVGLEPRSAPASLALIEEKVHPEDRAATLGAIRDAAVTGEALSLDHRVLLPDGSVRLFHTEVRPVREASGAVARLRGLEQDVTERRRAEDERNRLVREQARREEAEAGQRRAAFIAQITSVLASSLQWERTVSTACGFVVPEHADWSLVEVLAAPGRRRRVALAHRSVDEERLASLRRVEPRGDGDAPAARALASQSTVATAHGERVRDPDHRRLVEELGEGHLLAIPFAVRGRPFGVLVWCRRAAPYAPDEVLLAEEVARRTATAVEHATLYEEAQEANRLKDEFLATLSHELRTPIHAIVGWAHMLRSGSLDPAKTRRAIESIDRNAQVQNQLISDVLDVSRIVAGKLRLNVRRLDARSVVESALETVRPAADARRVRLRAEMPEQPVAVAGDPDRLQQVVWNLLSNAIKFVPEGGSVTVSLRTEDRKAVLSVEDDGPGIRPDFLQHVFERFRQADSSSTRPHGGLGLGLAIVRHLVELHGGTVDVRNRTDRSGAVFTVRLPVPATETVAVTARPDAQRRDEGAGQRRAEGALEKVKVLLVDDELDAREMVATVLELEGAEVLSAPSAAEGMSLLAAERPDVLLSDIEMPGMDGYELMRRVRALPPDEGGSVPAAALTAYAGPEHRVRALNAGFEMHVPKPVAPAELTAAVARLAGRGGRSVAARSGGARARVLVVDDNADVAESLQLLLSNPSREVVTARDGEEALAIAPRLHPDLVLLDLGLPGMDGFEVARRLRATQGLEHVRLVALSGYGAPADLEQSREAGFEMHLVKPVDPARLLALVEGLAPTAA